MQLELECPYCNVSSEHLVSWIAQSNLAVVSTVCLRCGATGDSSMDRGDFHLAIGEFPSANALETMTNTIRTAVLHSKSQKLSRFPNEGVWMLIGGAIGILIPVRDWLGLNYKAWIIVVLLIAALEMFAASMALKTALSLTPKRGWSIAKVMVLANIASTSKHPFLARLAAGIMAKTMLLVGLGAGQAMSIYFGLHFLYFNG